MKNKNITYSVTGNNNKQTLWGNTSPIDMFKPIDVISLEKELRENRQKRKKKYSLS